MSPAAWIWLASAAALPATGAPLLLHSEFRRFGPACRTVLAGVTGAVLLSWTMTLLSLFGVSWHLLPLLLLAAGQSFALRFALPRRGPGLSPIGGRVLEPEGMWHRAGVLLCGGAILATFVAALGAAATSADLLLFWGPKAQAFAAARRIDDIFLGEPFLRYLHTSYPPLVTNLYAFATVASGRFPWMAAAATSPLLLLACVAALPGILRRSIGRLEAVAAAASIAATLGFLSHRLEIAGNADMALLLFETLAVALLLGPDGESRAGQLAAGLLFAGAAAAKVEGLPFVVAAGVFFLWSARRRLSWPSAPLLLFAPAALSLGAWFAFGRATFLFHGYEGYGRTLDVHLERLSFVLAAIGKSMWTAGAAVPWLVPAAAWLAARSRSRGSLYPVVVAAVLSVFFLFTYLHGPDPGLWIQWSAGRIFMVLCPLFVLGAVTPREAGRDSAGSGGGRDTPPEPPD